MSIDSYTEISFPPYTCDAASDLTGKEFRLVKQTVDGIAICGAGEAAIGVLDYGAPAKGLSSAVLIDGILSALTGGVFASGVKLASDAEGRLVQATSGKHVVGIAMGDSAAAGRFARFVWQPTGKLA